MSGLKGICPKCEASYFGWALKNSPAPKCTKCGSELEIMENGVRIRTHYSSFTTKTYKTVYPTIRERS
jgi:transcription initiation factor IIE alpha subunit